MNLSVAFLSVCHLGKLLPRLPVRIYSVLRRAVVSTASRCQGDTNTLTTEEMAEEIVLDRPIGRANCRLDIGLAGLRSALGDRGRNRIRIRDSDQDRSGDSVSDEGCKRRPTNWPAESTGEQRRPVKDDVDGLDGRVPRFEKRDEAEPSLGRLQRLRLHCLRMKPQKKPDKLRSNSCHQSAKGLVNFTISSESDCPSEPEFSSSLVTSCSNLSEMSNLADQMDANVLEEGKLKVVYPEIFMRVTILPNDSTELDEDKYETESEEELQLSENACEADDAMGEQIQIGDTNASGEEKDPGNPGHACSLRMKVAAESRLEASRYPVEVWASGGEPFIPLQSEFPLPKSSLKRQITIVVLVILAIRTDFPVSVIAIFSLASKKELIQKIICK
ncbi:unnamed protein product [Protopolystoma xenopodis]|uniref:Uncharacterized protein n=1 Tax=Protopolystoma xenopodis TaxID=117903 RepID=A0A3S5B8F7_9PLAT|nr:unnamed protein product [Protopolystoma xenopodis]